jgi:flavin reductase (DIM6/NTAB) family NADH-FMN oxidoreductase RutF
MKQELAPFSLLPPCPVTVVCTYDAAGKPNGLAVSWTGVAVSEPPHVMISVRPQRYSHAALIETGVFTMNIPSEDQMAKADYFGLASGRTADKFEDTGLTPVKGTRVDAPMIEEFPLSLECRIVSSQSIGSHTVFLAEVLAIHADTSVLDEENRVSVEKLRPFSYDAAKYHYYSQGSVLGRAFSAGKIFRKQASKNV